MTQDPALLQMNQAAPNMDDYVNNGILVAPNANVNMNQGMQSNPNHRDLQSKVHSSIQNRPQTQKKDDVNYSDAPGDESEM